jgi:hypothetical protein
MNKNLNSKCRTGEWWDSPIVMGGSRPSSGEWLISLEVAHHQGEFPLNIKPRAFDVALSMDEPKEPKDMVFSPTLRSFVLVPVSYVGILIGRVWS